MLKRLKDHHFFLITMVTMMNEGTTKWFLEIISVIDMKSLIFLEKVALVRL